MAAYLSLAECAHSLEAVNALRTLITAVPRTRVALPVSPSAMSRVLNSDEDELDARSLAATAGRDQGLPDTTRLKARRAASQALFLSLKRGVNGIACDRLTLPVSIIDQLEMQPRLLRWLARRSRRA